ncbi:AAA domain-containing protein [Legionella sainthelensi]|uniref:AAA domain-containing protein n=1 Tax=Legionella sainthelensi TaxID=28087 RepID=UPI000E1FDAA4|nr:AAA domain-containing protein [Legionella sainthelensi]
MYKPGDLLISPIFKIPVDVVKDKRKKWSLKLEDNTVQLNPSLRLALRQKWGIKLPEHFESDKATAALEEFKNFLEESGKSINYDDSFTESLPKIPPRFKIIKNEEGEIIDRVPVNLEETLSKKEFELYSKVTANQFYIIDIVLVDHLNASRTVLLRDYDSILENSEMHPILSELFLGKPIPQEKSDISEQIKALDDYKEHENYFVVNIDSSQHRAIDQTAKSKVVVIQGPPGTGKSQTITNLIAEALSKGKKVLFVSEKRAALDVVYSRLKQANLTSQSVLIHSSDLNKQSLYNSFLELSDANHDPQADKEWDLLTSEFDSLKAEINSYYRILGMVHNPSNLFVSDLLTQYSDLKIDKMNISLVNIFNKCSFDDLNSICRKINELQHYVNKINNFSNHPWLYRKADAILTSSFIQLISDLVERIKITQETISKIKVSIADIGVSTIEKIPPSDALKETSELKISCEWLNFANQFYSDLSGLEIYQKQVQEILKIVHSEKDYYNLIDKNADDEIIRQLESYYSISHGVLDWCTPKFWRMRNYRHQCITTWDGTNKPFKSFRLLREAIKSFQSISQNKFLPTEIIDSDPQTIIQACHEINPILKAIFNIGGTMMRLGLIIKPEYSTYTNESDTKIKKLILDVAEAKCSLENQVNILNKLKEDLNQYFEIPLIDETDKQDFNYDMLIETMNDLEILDKIDLSIQGIRTSFNCDISKKLLINNFIPISENWGEYLFSSVIKWWIDEVITKYPELRNFERDTFHKKIEAFKIIEEKHRISAREFVNHTLSKRWDNGNGEFEGLSLLKKEANKQRKVLSPREIMERGALSTMLKLKPCWLMSPLSISQVLPISMGLFDIIIFDEASQVRVEDAIPSIYRAKSMVVVGDPKQMPPTNFFSAIEFVDDDDDDENDSDLSQSILDLSSQIYPSEILEWHYRSRSESLIAFSNRAFYGGRLIAAPNPYFLTEGDVIKFHQINNAYFNQKDGNKIEAESLVDRLAELLQVHSKEKSFGVIAMGQTQMVAIEDAIERRILTDVNFKNNIKMARTHIDSETDAHFFVKNLENVQGDERDIILISVGYAPSASGKKLFMNFGPLSKQGGSRRLNVAITRAKQKIEVVCSFDPNQIQTEEKDFGKNPDLVLFGRYLKYAKAISDKNYSEVKTILDSFGIGGAITTRKSSSFSKDVKRRLEELGYMVSAEIGSSGFYIDLCIHHPIIHTNFVLGIECDGALFHSTPYARDRDKIRQELLESRGWKIERIWSQDWSKDWKSEIARIDDRLKKILINL